MRNVYAADYTSSSVLCPADCVHVHTYSMCVCVFMCMIWSLQFYILVLSFLFVWCVCAPESVRVCGKCSCVFVCVWWDEIRLPAGLWFLGGHLKQQERRECGNSDTLRCLRHHNISASSWEEETRERRGEESRMKAETCGAQPKLVLNILLRPLLLQRFPNSLCLNINLSTFWVKAFLKSF